MIHCLVDLLRPARFCKMNTFLQFLLGNFSRVNLRRNDHDPYMAFLLWHVSCLRAICTPTGSSIQILSATFGSCLVLIPELDFFRASAVSAVFFETTSFVSLLMYNFYGLFQNLIRCDCFQSKYVLKCRVLHS